MVLQKNDRILTSYLGLMFIVILFTFIPLTLYLPLDVLYIITTEPILRLRKTSMMRMMRSFDHSGEDNNTRKRQYDEALGNGDETQQQNNSSTENDELKEGVSKIMDPPARERPAVSIIKCMYVLFIRSYRTLICDIAII